MQSKQKIVLVKPEEVKVENEILLFSHGENNFSFNLRELTATLSRASAKQLSDFSVSPSGYGIHWNELDEDISFTGLVNR
jgi:hypothetical protein